ncbi:MAG: thioredoxin family protein [Bacteroidales bacterium]|nr:thioredoxin family protein [Bacteroidales bacterium]
MKRVIPFIAVFIFIPFVATAQMQFKEIVTESEWKSALKEADNSGKLIFLDIYATWCGPCKYLESTIYPDVELGKYYNSHFINLKMDGETEFGRIKARQYGLKAYPTMYYLSPMEDVLAQVVGVKQAPELNAYGEKVVSSSDKLVQFKRDFEEDKLSATELLAYRELLLEFEQEEQSEEVSSKIIPSLTEEDILNPEYKSIILVARSDLDGKIFTVLKKNINALNQIWTEEERGQIFANIYDASLNVAISTRNPAYRDRIINELLPIFQNSPESMINAEYITHKLYFSNTDDWKSFGELVLLHYSSNFEGNDGFLYQESYDIVNNYSRSPQAVLFALELMNSAVKINSSFDNLIMISYLNGVSGNTEIAREYLLKVEAMPLTDQQKNILMELQNIIEQAG